MTWLLQSLVALTLLIAGGVALVPEIWSTPEPRARAAAPASPVRIWLVEGADGRWWLNGDPIRPDRLAASLALPALSGSVGYLPAPELSSHRVQESLRWLRRQTPAAVHLQPAPLP